MKRRNQEANCDCCEELIAKPFITFELILSAKWQNDKMAHESGARSQLFTIYLVKLVKDNDFRARRLAAQLNGMSYRAKDKDVCVRACVYLYKGMSEGDAVPERPLSMWPFVIPL